jgi:hypothetical protein
MQSGSAMSIDQYLSISTFAANTKDCQSCALLIFIQEPICAGGYDKRLVLLPVQSDTDVWSCSDGG